MGRYEVKLHKERKEYGVQAIHSYTEWEQMTELKERKGAQELARYILREEGFLPKEIECTIASILGDEVVVFTGEPDAVTCLSEQGEEKVHDLLLFGGKEIVLGVTALAGDEELEGQTKETALMAATDAVLAEAKRLAIPKAVVLIITFLREGCYDQAKAKQSRKNILEYKKKLKKYKEGTGYHLPGKEEVALYIEQFHLES